MRNFHHCFVPHQSHSCQRELTASSFWASKSTAANILDSKKITKKIFLASKTTAANFEGLKKSLAEFVFGPNKF